MPTVSKKRGSTEFTATFAASGSGAVPPSRVNTLPELSPRRQRGAAGPARRPDAGQGGDVGGNVPVECAGLLGLVALGERIDREHEETVGPKAEVDRGGVPAALHEEAGAHQEHHRHGHLDHDEPVRQATPRPAAAGVAPPRADGARKVDARRAQRRGEAREHAGRDGDRRRESEHPPVHGRVEGQLGQPTRARHGAGHDEIGAPDRDEAAADSAHRRQQHALGDELPHEPPPRRAETRAQGHLLPPRGAAADEQGPDVGDGDEQDEGRQAHDHAHQGPGVARRVGLGPRVTLGDDVELAVSARVRMLGGQGVREDVELGGGFGDGHAGPQPARQQEPLGEPVGRQVRPPRRDARGLGGGDVELDGHHAAGPGEGLRRDADDGHVGGPEAHDPPQDGRVPAEPRLPRAMRQHDERGVPGPAPFAREERAAMPGADLQDLEVVVTDVLDPHPLRRAAVHRQQRLSQAARGEAVEDVVALAVVDVLGPGQAVRELRSVLVELRHDHELVGVGHRQGLEEQGVRHGRDRGGGADADGQRQHRRRREPGTPREAAHADPHVGPQVVEPRQAALVAQGLHHLGKPAQPDAREPRRLGRRVTLAAQLRLRLFEMEPQLALEIVVGGVAPERSPNAAQAFTEDGHLHLPVSGPPRPGRSAARLRVSDFRPAFIGFPLDIQYNGATTPLACQMELRRGPEHCRQTSNNLIVN